MPSVPGDIDLDVIESGFPVPVIVITADFVCAGEPLSVTVTVKLEAALEVAVPEITPLGEIERPAGS